MRLSARSSAGATRASNLSLLHLLPHFQQRSFGPLRTRFAAKLAKGLRERDRFAPIARRERLFIESRPKFHFAQSDHRGFDFRVGARARCNSQPVKKRNAAFVFETAQRRR